jgi:hypothetical protein
VKIFKYAPGNPCSLGSLEEDILAGGFGLIYTWREPWYIRYLRGCIILITMRKINIFVKRKYEKNRRGLYGVFSEA